MKSVSLNVTETELDDMIKEGNTEANNLIDFPEFVTVLSRKSFPPDERKIRNAFNFFDRDGKECIDAKTLTEILHEVDEIIDEAEIKRLMKESCIHKKDDDSQDEPKLSYNGKLSKLFNLNVFDEIGKIVNKSKS
jgi:calmodulin